MHTSFADRPDAGVLSFAVREILLVDAALPDLDTLLRLRRRDVEVRMVESGADGLAAIEAAYAARPAAVHVLAHGEPGRSGWGAT
ncbi:MAG TPA: DUF4347 domain-containing protein [Azospirillum sp.]|nr:DUF4347 domain-containing protein [Azospirillum sp.]